MQINNKLFIKRYNHGNSAEFKKEKNELSKKFEILNDQTFQNDKNIYILKNKGDFSSLRL